MSHNQEYKLGLIYAFSAFGLWGLVPIYFKWVSDVSPLEILSHRILWSVLILMAVLTIRQQWTSVRKIRWPQLKPFFLSSVFVSSNWLIFIWAVGQDKILETSLGYFINPLVSLILGILFLGERLRRVQTIAVLLAALGVLNQIVSVGYLPAVALSLAFTFGFYGLMRKQVSIDPVIGLFLETILLSPFALAYGIWLYHTNDLAFAHISIKTDILLILAGVVTVLPLLLFAAGIQRLTLTVMGIAQYTVPTMTFCLAVFFYDEPFDSKQLVSFSCIWLGLILFTAEGIRHQKRISS